MISVLFGELNLGWKKNKEQTAIQGLGPLLVINGAITYNPCKWSYTPEPTNGWNAKTGGLGSMLVFGGVWALYL